jgi:hypothetical protein
MHHLRSIRRLALGAAVAAAVACLAPAMASADLVHNPTCTFNEGTHQVSVFDKSDAFQLQVARVGVDIAVRNEGGITVKCFSTTGSGVTANILNTDKITVFGTPTDGPFGGCEGCGPLPVTSDGYVIDESGGAFAPGFTPETDGNSEIEIVFETGGIPARLAVDGTDATASGLTDVIRVGGPLGFVNFGSDSDIDVKLRAGALDVTVDAGAGDDFITGGGNLDKSVLDRANVPLNLNGGSGADTVFGGSASDKLGGGSEDDFISSFGGLVDIVAGGPGLSDVAIHDPGETLTGVEHESVNPLGTLRLSPRSLRAQARKTTRLSMSWTHPKAWRELRKVELQLYDNGNKRVGVIAARARGLSARGAIKLVAGDSQVSHHGKTVAAQLALRLPRSLAGHNLRVAVQATDRHGHRQLEPDAGVIRVGK